MVAPGDLLTIRQALTILPVGRSTLYQLAADGEIQSFRVGKRILIRRKDLDAFIEKSRDGGAS